MRSIALLTAALTLGACTVVVQPGPSGTAPAQVAAPEPVIPLEITLARPVNGRLFVQTNRPAYVAIFEITPGQGVTLMQPANVRQRSVTYSGMTWVTASYLTERAATLGRARPAPAVHSASAPAGQRTRYIYALASDKPLAIPDEAFEPTGMRTLLGSGAYAASSPAVTMRTIARGFVPTVADEMWAEDALLMSAAQDERAQTTVRVYCGRGTVYTVPVEIADRVWCPGSNGTTRPASPDSVLHDNGRRVARRPAEPPGRRGVDRVANLPTDRGDRGNGVGRPEDRGVGKPDDRGDNGRKLGHTDPTKPGGGRAEPGRPEQAGRPATPAADTTRGNAGQPNRGQGNAPSQGNPPSQDKTDSSATSRGNSGVLRTIAVPRRTQPPQAEPTRSDPQPAETARPIPGDTTARTAPETKPDTKPETKPDTKPDTKPETKEQPAQPKPEDKAKADDKAKNDDKGKADDKAKPDSATSEKPKSEAARDTTRAPGRPRRPN